MRQIRHQKTNLKSLKIETPFILFDKNTKSVNFILFFILTGQDNPNISGFFPNLLSFSNNEFSTSLRVYVNSTLIRIDEKKNKSKKHNFFSFVFYFIFAFFFCFRVFLHRFFSFFYIGFLIFDFEMRS